MQDVAHSPELSEAEEIKKIGGAFRTISEVATELGVQQHVLRFWETKFNQIRPMKRGGGRRYYRPEDVSLLKHIHTLLYGEGYTIKGAQKLLKGQSKSAIALAQSATEAAEKARATASNMAPIMTAAKSVQPAAEKAQVTEVAPTQIALPPAMMDALQGMLSDLKELRSLVANAS